MPVVLIRVPLDRIYRVWARRCGAAARNLRPLTNVSNQMGTIPCVILKGLLPSALPLIRVKRRMDIFCLSKEVVYQQCRLRATTRDAESAVATQTEQLQRVARTFESQAHGVRNPEVAQSGVIDTNKSKDLLFFQQIS